VPYAPNATWWAHLPSKHVQTFWTVNKHQHPIAVFSTVDQFATGPPQTPPPAVTLAQISPEDTLRMPDLSNVLITYLVKVNRITATALLDTGAQLDFIYKAFMDRHSIATIKTSDHYVKMANGLRQDASHELQDATIDIQGFDSSCSLSVTALGQFDLILGMPWLTDIQPTIDVATKDATVTLDNGDIFTILFLYTIRILF
jgi:hypothetical protein